ncbi:MAG TPA: dihydrolipoamide acetyltransferase family protein [Gaiellaceae bacterium]|nr:dihydrolipoamide acetyltransferase family protein [Gaiellaceae bacterium]
MAATAAIDVVMPQMGVSVSEGTITKWLKQEGEQVAADEPLLEISTDKVDTEVPSPGEGVVQQILVQEGETVDVGTKLAVIAPAGSEAPAPAPAPPAPVPEQAGAPEPPPPPAPPPPPEPAAEEPAPPQPPPEPAAEEPAPAPPPPPATPPEPAPATDGAGEKTFVSPVVARIASEHGVDVSQVSGTGRGGRVTKKDIMAFVESGGQAAAPPPAPPAETAPIEAPAPPPPPAEPPAPAPPPEEPVAAPAAPAPPPQAQPVAASAGEEIQPMNAMRRGIAEHMRRSLDTSAHVTTVFEIDLSKVVALRKKLKPEYEESYGVNLTYLAFIARATIEAIKNWPWVNAEIRGEQIVIKHYVNLGIAVALEGGHGLIVPVIKNAEGLNLLGIARGIVDIADRARNKKLTPDDVQGGTFTITNPGGWGAIIGTPIISQPQVAILDVEALVKRPVVVQDADGQDVIAIRPMMNLCLSYDHRLVDGAYAAQFMKELRENLETFDEGAY